MYSIYHFFNHLIKNKSLLQSEILLSDFPFDTDMLSCQNNGIFPDLAIRTNTSNPLFSGGELIELKDSKSYTVSSFNSTIPTGTKDIVKIIKGENSIVKKQMEAAGDDINSLPVRDVFYLIRGRNKENVKVVLIHGNFFETVKSNKLISQSFEQVLKERLQEKGINIESDIQDLLVDIFSEQENFSKVRNVDKASVKLRFQIMTEVKAEGNIFNPRKYPDIKDNTINLIVPYHTEQDKELAIKRLSSVCDTNQFTLLKVKHHLNGYFLVFQQSFL
jgi:hypothetical protein